MKITEVFETGSLRNDAYLYVAQKELQDDGSYKESFRRIPLNTFLDEFAKGKQLRARLLSAGYTDKDDVDHGAVFEPGPNFEHPNGNVCGLVLLTSCRADDPVVLRHLADGIDDYDAATVGQVKKVDLTTENNFNDAQKSQARKNIGAMGYIADKNLDMNEKDIEQIKDLRIKGVENNYVVLSSTGIFKEHDGTTHAILDFDDVDGAGVVLRNICPGINPGDAATVGLVKDYVDKFAGDIETALDRIIDIQNALVGTITFTHAGRSFTAEYGMTWADWCDSEYNTAGLYVGDDGMVYDSAGDAIAIVEGGQPGHTQYGTYVIEADADYTSL